ncbi:efflux ABC transporter transmembrane ATP-binding protein [Actibacterium atlanticum]|uniref:Efflux ABC transporter transmembrane ATP-binding protein n=2 Tax=Actibacterium atlanticum TaxID=1461693 RepID=A0A058ZIP5_9RHOB|nr:efflux ABC transporter transmembrane ATP-binding protein [Actibacterium atlanticum]
MKATNPRMSTPTQPIETKILFPWIWRKYLRKYLGIILIALAMMSIDGAALGALSYLIEPMFDDVLVTGDRGAVPMVGLMIFGLFLVRAFAGFGHKVLMARVGQKVNAALQYSLLAHMQRLDNQFFHTNAPGNLIERVRGDTEVTTTLWSQVLVTGGRDFVSIIALFAVAMSVDWLWTLIAFAAVPLLVFPVSLLQRLVRKSSRIAREEAAGIATKLDEIFHGITTIKLNRLEEREEGIFDRILHGFVRARLRSETTQAGIPAMVDIVAGAGFFGVLTYGGYQIIEGQKTVGEFMSFFTAIALLFEPLRRMGRVSGILQASMASIERLYMVFQEHPTIVSPAQPQPLPCPGGQADIVLDNVVMAYDDQPVLNGLSLTARAGQMTALVGPSGAGKSTIFNLLSRLVEPQQGQITLAGVPIEQMALEELRGQFSVVSQDSSLFDETLRDNILLGRTDVSDARLNEILDAAHVNDFLPKLPNGLDSRAGPRGSSLSGGQRQRVAIARALIQDAPILLLDEATSALDAKSEKVVQEALERLAKNRTTLVIAHRLATVREADNIIVMDKGRVVEQGTHDELLAQDGIYSGLYRLQFATEK